MMKILIILIEHRLIVVKRMTELSIRKCANLKHQTSRINLHKNPLRNTNAKELSRQYNNLCKERWQIKAINEKVNLKNKTRP